MAFEYLLALQNLRLALGSGIESAVAFFSDVVGAGVVVFACIVMYWCFNKKMGTQALFSLGVGYLCTQVIKCTACVYRPWILESRVMPAEASIDLATGYSLPSGHTTLAGTVLGSFAYSVRKDHRGIAVALVVLALFMGFCRNFLGVHTLEDVLVALVVCIVAVLACARFTAWLEVNRQHDGKVLIAALVVTVIALAYIMLKPYPLDYVEGELLVDPLLMQTDCFEGIGVFTGLFLGWYCERRWVNFTTDDLSWKTRLVRLAIGVVLILVVILGIDPLLKMVLDPHWAKFVSRVLALFMGVFVAPAVFMKVKA